MKKNTFFLFAIISFLFSFMTLTGCGNGHDNESLDTQTLIVERQHVRLDGTEDDYFNYFKVAVDVPLEGPEPLLDAVMEFLNEKLYYAFENVVNSSSDKTLYISSQVYTEDFPNLLYSYAEKYKEAVKETVTNTSGCNLLLLAQTESFVTYGLELYQDGTNSGSGFQCYTFSKEDGHLVDPLVKEKKLLSLLKNLAEDKQLFGEGQLRNSNIEEFCDVALLEKGLLLVNNQTYYKVCMLEYKDVLPYLSDEAKKMVKTMGDSTQNNSCRYFIGERLGNLQTVDGKNIILTQDLYFPEWGGAFFEDEDNYRWLYGDEDDLLSNSLKAFYVDNGKVTPAPVIDKKDGVCMSWDNLFTTNPTGQIYAFNPIDNTLYLPCVENVMMGMHDCYDKYEVYEFNGFEFVHEVDEGGFWLHPSLRQFGRLCYMGRSDDYIVRVDELRVYDDRYDGQLESARIDTCRYRYAAWKNKNSMLGKPDLVICDGCYNEETGTYIFKNAGYDYIVDKDHEKLSVLRNGKLIMQENITDGVVLWE